MGSEMCIRDRPCVAYLFVLLHAADSTRQGFATGYVFGLGLFGAGVYWVYYSLHLFGAAIAPLAAIGTLLFVMVLALYTGLFGWLVKRFSRHNAVWFLLITPSLWLLIEWFRSWFLTGFPWLSLGYITIDTPLAGFAPVGGVFLNSLLIAFCCGALAYVFVVRKLATLIIVVGLITAIAISGQVLRGVSLSLIHI